jgi:hypothetical protein
VFRTPRTSRALAALPIALLAAGATLLAAPDAVAGTRPVGAQPAATVQDTCQQQSTLAGDHYSDLQIAQVARGAGFTGNGWVTSVAVALAESQGWTQAVLINTDCSRDRGLWQINSYWHGEISDAQAFDPAGCAQAAYQISSGGADWTPWTTYNNGAYQQYWSRAQAAVQQAGG